MSQNNYYHRDIRHQSQYIAPQASQITATSYHSPPHKQHTTQYFIPTLQSDANSQWSDTDSTTNLSETSSLPRSEIERLIREDTEGDRRRYDKWKQWARKEEKEDGLAVSVAVRNARRAEYSYRLEVPDRQTREYKKLKVGTDRGRRVYLQKLEADEQWEADRRERLRTNFSRNNHPRKEHTTMYVSGTSGRQLPYPPLSDGALIGIARESERRNKRRH
ncbi:hypothetical protein EAE96_003072 [Botrytis aclada]|nr:hypothetical protein EAE96_003072 [Botrytis aclada]